MKQFRAVVEAIGTASGDRLKSVTVWGEAEGDLSVPPAFSAHVTLDGSEYIVAVVPTRGAVTPTHHAPGTE